jgi:hypothetical protein
MNSDDKKNKILLEWRKLYSEALIDALNPKGAVLQIGFGQGFAADRIQKFKPTKHVIIESNPQTFEEAKKWANKKLNVVLVQDTWENALANQGDFDALFVDDRPTVEDNIAVTYFLFPEETRQTSEEVQKLLISLEKQIKELAPKFSNQDIEDFYQKTGQYNLAELPRFFQKLRENGNISQKQYEGALKKYLSAPQKADSATQTKKTDSLLRFLEKALGHMSKGGRLTAFLGKQTSKYEDAQFFDEIITNVDLDYTENAVSIKMSDTTRQGLIILIEKSR